MSLDQSTYSYAPNEPMESPRRGFPWGCVLGGCLGVVILGVVGIAVSGFAAYRFYSSQLAKYTSEEARQLPSLEFSEEQIAEVEKRVNEFQQNLEENQDSQRLVLSEEDLNALLASNEDLRGKVYVHIQDGQIRAELSMPADIFPGGKGRFFNGDVTFEIALESGELLVRIDQATVGEEPVPEAIMNELRNENFGDRIMQDPDARKSLRQFERIIIEGDQLILVPKAEAESGTTEETAADDESGGTEGDGEDNA